MAHFKKHTHRKQRPVNDNEKAGMATLLAKIRALREQAVNATTPSKSLIRDESGVLDVCTGA